MSPQGMIYGAQRTGLLFIATMWSCRHPPGLIILTRVTMPPIEDTERAQGKTGTGNRVFIEPYRTEAKKRGSEWVWLTNGLQLVDVIRCRQHQVLYLLQNNYCTDDWGGMKNPRNRSPNKRDKLIIITGREQEVKFKRSQFLALFHTVLIYYQNLIQW